MRKFDAVAYKWVSWLVGSYGFVVVMGDGEISGKEFADKILAVFGEDNARAMFAADLARKRVKSIVRKCGDITEVEWKGVK